jgi:hypothetical protein
VSDGVRAGALIAWDVFVVLGRVAVALLLCGMVLAGLFTVPALMVAVFVVGYILLARRQSRHGHSA